MIRRPPRSTQSRSSAASDVYKRQVLHRLGAPVIHCRHLLPRPLNVHIVAILLRRRCRRSRFGSRNHLFLGGLVPTSSSRRRGGRRGRRGGFAPGKLSGTACGLLLLLLLLLQLRDLAVTLAMNAFSRLALLSLGVVPLLVTLLATNKASYWRFRSTFTPAVLGLWFASWLSAALPCSLVSAAATDLASRRFAVCRRAASLASITGWSRRLLVYDVEQCIGVMHYEIEPHLAFHLAAKL